MRKSVSSLALAIATILASSHAALAQEADDTAGVVAAEPAAEPQGGIEEVVVTAQRRAESLQTVPLSVQAFSGETMAQAGINTVLDLPRLAPNFNAARGTQTANVRLSIRGVGAAGNSAIDPSIGTFIDGVYVPRAGSLFGAMNDISSAEVLRGPQGTLFGRNSTVGAVLLNSTNPGQDFGGDVELQFGSYNQQKAAGVLNMPVSDKLAFRIAALHDSHDGYAYNRYDKQDFATSEVDAGRIGMSWDLTDSLNWTVKYDWSQIGGDGKAPIEIDPDTLTANSRLRLNLITGGNPPDLDDAFDNKSNQRITGDVNDKQWGVVSNLSWNVAGDYTLKLLSGYRKWDNDQLESDVLFMPADFLARTGLYASTSQSHELQLVSPQDELLGGRLDYVAGLYYFQEDFQIGETFGLGANFCGLVQPATLRPACVASGNKATATVLDFNQDADNFAAYAQGNIGITDTVDVVLGARWTQDSKSGSFVQHINNPFGAALRAVENTALSLDDDQFTYRVGLNWNPNRDLLVFGSYSTGYKSGGFNSGGGAVALGQKRLFDKETTDNYEVGAKWTFADGRGRLNGTLFRMDLGDFQDRAFDGQSFNVINAGDLRNQGVELNADWAPVDWLSLYAAAGYLDAEFAEYPNAACLPYLALVPTCTQDLKGETPVYAPEWQGSVGAELRGDLGFANLGYAFRTDVSYMDDINVGQVNDNNPQGVQSAYTLVSARFSLLFGANRQFAFSVFGDNLTDEGYCSGKVAQPFDNLLGLRDPVSGGTVMRCQVAPPRTYGISVKASF